MNNEEELLNIKKALEDTNAKYNKLKGKKETLTEQLKDLGYENIKKGQNALDELEDELEDLEAHFEEELNTFKQEYADLLEK